MASAPYHIHFSLVVITNGAEVSRFSNCNLLCVRPFGCCALMASAPYHIYASLWWSLIAHRYRIRVFQLQLALFETFWVLRAHGISTLSHSFFTVVITNGAEVSRFSNCNLLCVRPFGCCSLMASAPYHIHASLWWSLIAHRYRIRVFQFHLALCETFWVLRPHGISTVSHSCLTVVTTELKLENPDTISVPYQWSPQWGMNVIGC